MGKTLRQKYNPPIPNQGLNHIFPTKSTNFRAVLAYFPVAASANTARKQMPERDGRQ